MKKHDFKEILAKIDAIEPADLSHEKKSVLLQEYSIKAVVALIDVTEDLNHQNQRLEKANTRLQKQLLILTIVMGILTAFTFVFDLLNFFQLSLT